MFSKVNYSFINHISRILLIALLLVLERLDVAIEATAKKLNRSQKA